jgi:crossover junction endodeoxyribonuclease RusA
VGADLRPKKGGGEGGLTLLILPPPISANRYWRKYRNQMVISDEARAYKLQVQRIALDAGADMLTGDVSIRLDVYREAKRGDLDNKIKVILDSLQGILYADDKQIVEIYARRFDDKRNPRAVIEIRPASDAS